MGGERDMGRVSRGGMHTFCGDVAWPPPTVRPRRYRSVPGRAALDARDGAAREFHPTVSRLVTRPVPCARARPTASQAGPGRATGDDALRECRPPFLVECVHAPF